MTTKNSITLIQITDLHLFEDPTTSFLGINPYESLKNVVANIESRSAKGYQPDVILLTGDISQDFSVNSYKLAAGVFNNFSCPVLATLGNHDEKDLFQKIICKNENIKCLKKIILGNWRILILDSHYNSHVAGYLSNDELQFLTKELESDVEIPTVIFLHHHVLPTDCAWLDMLNLSNAEDFLKVTDKFKNIVAVFCGHVHQDFMAIRKTVAYFSTPAVCWQFARNAAVFTLDNLMPGYRVIELNNSGECKTEVVRLDFDKKFVPNLENKGY